MTDMDSTIRRMHTPMKLNTHKTPKISGDKKIHQNQHYFPKLTFRIKKELMNMIVVNKHLNRRTMKATLHEEKAHTPKRREWISK